MQELTPQEQKVFDMLLAGIPPKEIGSRLYISYDTVATHQKNVYRKRGVKSLQELLVKYLPPRNDVQDTAALAEQPLPDMFALTLVENLPHGGAYTFAPDVFQHNGKWYPSPFKLGKNNRLIKDEIYQVTCFFTANVDLEHLVITFADTSIEEDDFWTPLSGVHKLGNNDLKANTKYRFSTKMLVTQTANGALPAENMLRLQSGCFAEGRQIMTFHKFEVIRLPYMLKQLTFQEQKTAFGEAPVPYPLVITLEHDDSAPWRGWRYIVAPDFFNYNGELVASPFRLGKGSRIIEDDIFLVNLFFSSNVDMDFIQVVFIDSTLAEDNHETQLSPFLVLKKNIQAGVETSITIKLLANKNASGTSPAENQFVLMVGPKTKEQPTLTFTKFEVLKIN